ncbi:MAG: tRNA (adenosine(37)-N6)-threonylcarbamoyltransferase complex ATPase subunit type 1 TsaE [Mariprofundaceae bacterium]|nr:tRNA (adenosine(37)-N6)-threonylcarbamoyltransferase complex ATPase subunit type 1 TsaE [Mariprofundaceae bacterium]
MNKHGNTQNSTVKPSIFLADEAATKSQAETLAKNLHAGDCIALSGELGAGKSLFARALMRALGVRDHALPSPSFSLIEEYHVADGMCIAHMDWYRLDNAEAVIMLGVQDYFNAPWVSIIEWPERAPCILPQGVVRISLTLDANIPSARWFTIG